MSCLLPLVLTLALPTSPPADPLDLFANGLDDWLGAAGYWRMEGDVLVGESTTERPLDATTYLIWTGGEVADFELELSFRITGGNSGIQFRSTRGARFAVSGYQADLEDGPNWTGGLYEQDGRGVVCRRGQRVELGAGGERTLRALPNAEALESVVREHDWNTYRVRAVGPTLELFLNGVPSAVIVDADPARARAQGILALQLHQGPPMRIEYRDVHLTHLGTPPEPRPRPVVTAPSWIWSRAEPAEDQALWATRSFDLDRAPARAVLRGSGDDTIRVALDGQELVASSEWWTPFQVELPADVVAGLRAGTHVLSARCKNGAGPAGLWLELELEDADGSTRLIRSDGLWLVSESQPDDWTNPSTDAGPWRPATVLGPLGMQPWGTPTSWGQGSLGARALDASQLELLPGFEAELLYSVPLDDQGSWVCLTFDPQGRLVASDQYGALYRMMPPPIGSAEALQVETLELELGSAQGLLFAFDSLYVVVAYGENAGLWRAQDTDGDDRFDDVTRLFELHEGGEHGPHALRVAPDGASLLLIAGNHTPLPEGLAHSRVPRVWAEDQLLPRRDDPGGHAVGIEAPGGWLVRLAPDGTQLELVASGMRNAYDFDVSPGGEVFTFDSDMEWDVGLPWYRPTRILHLVSGADFGWRTGSGKWPAYFADSLPAVLDLGLASPTGVEFGTRTAFHGPHREALFCADWAYGTIHAVHLEAHGASFRARSEVFARGTPFPVTDLTTGPEGALYVTTGGRGTQSGLYRIHSTRDAAPEPRARRPAPERRALETLHGREASPAALDEAWSALGSPDPFVAHAARTALEHTSSASWGARALGEGDPRAALQALLALVRTTPGAAASVRVRLAELPVWSRDTPLLLPALRVLALTFVRAEGSAAAQGEAWSERLLACYPSGEPRAERELFRALVFLGSKHAARLGLEAMTAPGVSQEDALFYAFHLRTLESGWTLPLRRRYFRWLNEETAVFEGGASLARYIDAIRDDARERLPEELRVWPELLENPAPQARSAPVEAAAFVRSWSEDDLVPHLSRLAAGRDAARGARAYETTSCAECHRLDGRGGATGPDLTGAGARFQPRDLLRTLLEPSRTISDQYQETEVRTTDGRLLVGRVVREDEASLTLRVATPTEQELHLPRAEIESTRISPLSRMPSGLLDTLELDEVLDLLAWVLSGGDDGAPAFRRDR